jgi:hypothetical protein
MLKALTAFGQLERRSKSQGVINISNSSAPCGKEPEGTIIILARA